MQAARAILTAWPQGWCLSATYLYSVSNSNRFRPLLVNSQPAALAGHQMAAGVLGVLRLVDG